MWIAKIKYGPFVNLVTDLNAHLEKFTFFKRSRGRFDFSRHHRKNIPGKERRLRQSRTKAGKRGEEQNREEGEIGSESREKGDLPPCSSPLW